MAKVMVERNILIVIILVVSLVCCAVSAGVATLVVNSEVNTVTGPQGEKGDKGDTGATGATGATGQTGATGPTGATGATGATGTAGTNGATWLSGTGAPSASLGVTGDYYLNTATNDIYRKDAAGTWVKQTNLQLNNKAQYDSGWVDISSKAGQNIAFAHNLNTTNLQIQIQGKDANGNIHQKYLGLESLTVSGWNQTYGENSNYIGYAMASTVDGGSVIAGAAIKELYYAEESDIFLLKLDSDGYADWSRTFDVNYTDFPYGVIQTADGGYAITGYTYSLNPSIPSMLIIKTDSEGILEWSNTYGEEAVAYSIIQTNDGGYAITGQNDTELFVIKTFANGTLQWMKTYGDGDGEAILQTSDNGFIVAGGIHNDTDYTTHAYLVKIDANGVLQWNKTLNGGTYEEYVYSLIAASDGGFILAGNAYAPNYQSMVYLAKTNANGVLEWNKTYSALEGAYGFSVVEADLGGYVIGGYVYTPDGADYIILKTSDTGVLEWNQTYSNSEYDRARTLVKTSDGGYAMVGYCISESSEYAITFVIKTYSNGTLNWSQTYGGSSREYGYDVIATSDGGYAIAGYIREQLSSYSSVYLVKTTSDGTFSWAKTYDCGLSTSRGYSVIQTSDGGYAITGIADQMALLLKADANGTLQWIRTFEAGGLDTYGYSVQQTSDGGYAIAGYTYTSENSADVFLVKTDKDGALQWNQTYGGPEYELGYDMVLTSSGEYVIAGYIEAENDDGYEVDVLLLKVGVNGTMQWMKIYNSTGITAGYSLAAALDGGYAIAGERYSETDYIASMYVIKTDADGTMQWNQTYSTGNYDQAYSIVATADGGYAIGGYSESITTYSYDILVVKASSNGTLQWTKTIDCGFSERGRAMAATSDGSFVIAGYNNQYDIILHKLAVTLEEGLANVATTNNTITVYRGLDDSYWQYVRIQIWKAD